jgi:heparosan-N-sulfate-glucuronate 5-epimerase
MSFSNRIHYLRRIFRAYLVPGKSQLTFWHEVPLANSRASFDRLGEYYMTFAEKADYGGRHDADGIPVLDYHGRIGLQYNPIAIAQYGLGNCNLYAQTSDAERKRKFLAASDWMRAHLEQNGHGAWVWMHKFDWEYRDTLKAPWYSGLAQGQGISLLVRAHRDTGDGTYLAAAERAFESFSRTVKDGGVMFTDEQGDRWIEEYLVDPPTHILNGFLWAAWGVRDFGLATGDERARELFAQVTQTLLRNIDRYDLGFWSLYEQSGTLLKMVASPFYHRLHIVQLRIMQQMTGEKEFGHVADRWEAYARSRAKRAAALCYKSAFKLCYY